MITFIIIHRVHVRQFILRPHTYKLAERAAGIFRGEGEVLTIKLRDTNHHEFYNNQN